MTSRHYHVIATMPGCLPETNDVFTNRRHAEKFCKELKDGWKEGWPEGFSTGNAETGYQFYKHDGDHVIPILIYVDKCHDIACLDEEEGVVW